MSEAPGGNPRLLSLIRDEVRARGTIPFARFMDLALHHPEHGYYAAGPERLGERGDFITASDLGPEFGDALATQLVEFDATAGSPDPFRLLEFGAGRGWLGRDLLDALERDAPALAARTRYAAVDASAGMRASIAGTVPGVEVASRVDPAGGAPGVAVAVELFDALPVHRVVRREGRLREIAVTLEDDGALAAVETAPAPAVEAWATRYGAAPSEGDEAEVCLALDEAFAAIASALGGGFVLVFDYGDTTDRLYTPDRRRGTLLAYHRHRTNEDYFDRVGEQDLTAHVNFTALADAAATAGWRCLGSTTQDRFLIANGFLRAFESIDESAYRDPAEVERRWKLKRLIDPGGMGKRFRAAVFAKGVPEGFLPRGLADPFAR